MGRQSIQTQNYSLASIFRRISDGSFQVPPFQRDFVWTRDMVKDLFDSIRNGYPIGSVLIWRPLQQPGWQGNRLIGGFQIPDGNPPQSYILDGCQRLSTLFGCLTNPKTTTLHCVRDIYNEFFNLYYDLKEDCFIYPAKSAKYYQVPVCLLMSTSEFRKYSREILEKGIKNSEELDEFLNRADELTNILLDYKLPIIEVDEASLDDAVNIFSRINSKGTDISYDWMVNALSFKNGFNFSFEIDSLLESLREYNFEKIPRDTLFRCYQSAFDDNLYFDNKIDDVAKREDFPVVVKKMTPAIKRAVKFLFEELKVIDARLLPYTAHLPFLAVFFMRVEDPDEKQLADLKRWIWVTTYSNYFTAAPISMQRKAFRHFLKYINKEEPEILYKDDNLQAATTLEWPKLLALSAVRSIALVLFELNHAFEYLNIKQIHGVKLQLNKIFKNQERLPENIIVTEGFSQDISKEDKVYYDINFFPASDNISQADFLEERKRLIQQKEQEFVKNLGLTYKY